MILTGKKAVKAVAEQLGRELTRIESRVVLEEGYSTEVYEDTKGIRTTGVGQTGEFMHMRFDDVVDSFVRLVRRLLPDYDSFPEYLQEELVQSAYRGDILGSPKTRKLINAKLYQLAAHEFLRNDEYEDPRTPVGIKKRIKSVADALFQYSDEVRYGGSDGA